MLLLTNLETLQEKVLITINYLALPTNGCPVWRPISSVEMSIGNQTIIHLGAETTRETSLVVSTLVVVKSTKAWLRVCLQ